MGKVVWNLKFIQIVCQIDFEFEILSEFVNKNYKHLNWFLAYYTKNWFLCLLSITGNRCFIHSTTDSIVLGNDIRNPIFRSTKNCSIIQKKANSLNSHLIFENIWKFSLFFLFANLSHSLSSFRNQSNQNSADYRRSSYFQSYERSIKILLTLF